MSISPGNLRTTSTSSTCGKLLQAIVHPRQVHAENIFAFVQIGRFQHLLALQRAVGLHFDCAQLGNPDSRRKIVSLPSRAPT